MSARAAVLTAPKQIELRAEEVPQPRDGAIVVRVRAALTDGTDLKAYRRGHREMPFPTRFGHEFSGDVAAVGAGVDGFAVGDAVMSAHSAPCGHCFWCARGEDELCETIMLSTFLGAYADYIEIPARILARNTYAKPASLPYEEAAFLEPLSCVVHSRDVLLRALGEPHAGAIAAIVGDGGFGLLHAQVLRASGLRPVLFGRRDERLAIARAWGVQTSNVRDVPLADAVRQITGGRGADAAIECTGSRDVWEAAPELVRRGGVVSFFGGLPSGTNVSLSAAALHYDERRLISPFHFTPRAVRAAYELLTSGTVSVKPLVTQRFALENIADAFARLDGGEGIKFAIVP
jgi:L-iditol 2-dehydrogenase